MATAAPDTFQAKSRDPGKKGHARRLRASGWVPAVAYGPSIEPQHLAVDPKTFLAARMEHGVAHIYNVAVEGGEVFKALIKNVDRHPVNRTLNHVDLYAVDMTKTIHVRVRVDLVGKPKGAIDGGLLQQVQRRIEVECLPGNLPSHIDLDVTELNIGDVLHLSDLPLPEGVKTLALDDEAVVIMAAPIAEEVKPVEEEVAEGDAAAAAAADPKAAKPDAKPE